VTRTGRVDLRELNEALDFFREALRSQLPAQTPVRAEAIALLTVITARLGVVLDAAYDRLDLLEVEIARMKRGAR
jgi:hypothetical protein